MFLACNSMNNECTATFHFLQTVMDEAVVNLIKKGEEPEVKEYLLKANINSVDEVSTFGIVK
jgi:hypothetical protein